jgi:endonuclease/exonuclease/phosphatase family metal-dependent hydrolase
MVAMKSLSSVLLRNLEAGLMGLFFVQAVRFLYGTLYAHIGSLDQLSRTVDLGAVGAAPGFVTPSDVQLELLLLGIALLLPLSLFLFGRFGTLIGAVAAAGRVYMTFGGHSTLGVIGAIAAAGSGALYAAVLARRRADQLPFMFVIGFGLDQVIRTYGGSVDLTWDGTFLPIQAGISLVLFLLTVLNLWLEGRERRHPDYQAPPKTQIAGWGAVALGGLLYLEFAILGLPNTLARRAGGDGVVLAPYLVVATLLPLVPAVRELARRFLVIFDAQWRGWVWFLLTGLLFVVGYRFQGSPAAIALLVAQFLLCLSWWWLVQPAEGRGNFSGAALTIGLILFLVLSGADYFTYDYAFVRGLQEPFGGLVRGFRGLGLAVVIVAVLLVNLPAIVARKRLPFRGGRFAESGIILLSVALAGGVTYSFASPIFVQPPSRLDRLRIVTLNLHGGYSLYFDQNLNEIALEIQKNGADVVLLQEVETGRMVSYGVDQVAWLAQAVGMQATYFPTNEALQGMAILTRLPIVKQDTLLLSSLGKQTGVQYVQLQAIGGVVLNVYNTQLGLLLRDSGRDAESQQQDQLRQVEEVFGLIALNDPNLVNRTILGGTFNNTPGSDVYQKLAAYFADPFSGLAAEKAITWRLINNVTSRVDYLWVRNVISLSAGVAELQATTHNMPVVEIRLTTP